LGLSPQNLVKIAQLERAWPIQEPLF
jgi:hypothetical protein